MIDLRECEFGTVNACRSWIGLSEVAYKTADGTTHGPSVACASHRRWLAAHVVTEWVDPESLRRLSEEEALWLREEQDIEDIIDSDYRLLPRGLR